MLRKLLPIALLVALAAPVSAGAATLAPPSGQVLRIGVGELSQGGILDPAEASYQDTTQLQRAFLEPLYYPTASGRLLPALAAGQPSISANGLRIVVRLRAARWSDGAPVVARDVVTAYTRASARSVFASFTVHVSRVTAVGARVVRIDLKRRDPVLVAMLTSTVLTPVPSHVIAKAKERWTRPGVMVASGAFVLTAQSKRLTVGARNPRYFGARGVKLRSIRFLVQTDAQARAAYRSGAIDATFPRSVNEAAAVAAGGIVSVAGSAEAQYAYLNTRSPRLRDARVRRGIALAVDRAGIAAQGRGTVLSTMVPPSLAGAAPLSAGARLLAADGVPQVDAAKAQLAAGGWSDARSLTLLYSSTSGNAGDIARSIRSSLATVGVTVRLKAVSSDQLFTPGYGISPVRAEHDIVLMGWIADYPEPWTYYQLFTCDAVKIGLNASNYCATGYDAAARPLVVQYSPSVRLASFRRLEQQLTGPAGAFPIVPLYEPTTRSIAQPWVHGYAADAFGELHLERIALLAR